MPRPLENVVVWRRRIQLFDRVVPPHLKLAILSRGRISLPAENVEWMLQDAARRGPAWLKQLSQRLADVSPTVPVTIELFLNQRPWMTEGEIDETLHSYLTLRKEQHLPGCSVTIFTWGTHARRQELERNLDVDFSTLYRRAYVQPSPRDADRYILVVYACLPESVTEYITLPRPSPPSTPPPAPDPMTPLEGLLTRNGEWQLRQGPGTDSNIMGQLYGRSVRVHVLDKAEKDGFTWYQIELTEDLQVQRDGGQATLTAGTTAWLVREGFHLVAAPWAFFRNQLFELEKENSVRPLSERITRLRQLSHAETIPFDTVIGTPKGTIYKNSIPFIEGRWQLFRDYEAVRAPDERIVDIHHLLVGLDVLQRPEATATFFGIAIGTNYGAATWAGDVGAAVADMMLAVDALWERRAPRTPEERATHYYMTRAPDWDLLGDVDAWAIHASRRPGIQWLDRLLALYYEDTCVGSQRTLVTGRQDALERFLRHYGFRYEPQHDLAHYPSLQRQEKSSNRIHAEIAAFAGIWLINREKARLISRNPRVRRPNQAISSAMTLQFLYWLEVQVIENGAVVPRSER